MRGVCVDINNHPPTAKQLRALGADGVRIEIRMLTKFKHYVQALQDAGIQVTYLWGPSTDLDLNMIGIMPVPDLLIIGNEPDGLPSSMSWKMTILEYCAFYNAIVAAARVSTWDNVPISTAGMISGTQYLAYCWDRLRVKPNVVNVHYPDSAAAIQDFKDTFGGRDVIVGETCYETGTKQEIIEWQQVLNATTESSFWFQWIDFPGWTGSLYSTANKPKSLYYSYKAALRS